VIGLAATHSELQEFFLRFRRSFGRAWSLYRRSRLGIVGLIIILGFTFMAVFAPWLAPYDPHYLAPDEDFFDLRIFNMTVEPSSESYEPVVGPTLPTYVVHDGAMYVILAERSGIITILRGREPRGDESPFDRGNWSRRLDIRVDFGVPLEPPLSNVVWFAPGVNALGGLGNFVENGAIAFVANTTFVVYNPFANQTLLARDIGFLPEWVVQDPLSAGQMYDIPTQTRRCFGAVCLNVGPYRYVAFGAENQTKVLRVKYLNSDDLPITDVLEILNLNVTLDERPLLYHNRLFPDSSGIFLPMNGTQVDVYDLLGNHRTTLNLTVGGETARLTTRVVASRASTGLLLFAPVEFLGNGTGGILYVSPTNVTNGDVTIQRTFFLPSPDMRIDVPPDNNAEGIAGSIIVYTVANVYEGGVPVRAQGFKLTPNATINPILAAEIDEPVTDLYYVFEASRMYALGVSGAIYGATTVSEGGIRAGLTIFLEGNSSRTWIQYIGGFLGTTYGKPALSAQSVYGLALEPTTGNLTIYQFVGNTLAPLPPGTYPSGNTYLFGTDNVGQDVLSWLIWGSRIALLVGVLAALSAVLIGTLVGLVAGYYGRLTDTLLMRSADITLVLPALPIILILTAILGQSVLWIVVIIAVLSWPGIARVIRAQTLSLRERPFVDAARISGASNLRIMFVHLAPNVLPFTFLYMTLLVAGAIILEAAISFLGLGDAKAISWGQMLNTLSSSGSTTTAWWWLIPPGLAITMLSMGFYFVGRAVDEIVNPRLRER